MKKLILFLSMIFVLLLSCQQPESKDPDALRLLETGQSLIIASESVSLKCTLWYSDGSSENIMVSVSNSGDFGDDEYVSPVYKGIVSATERIIRFEDYRYVGSWENTDGDILVLEEPSERLNTSQLTGEITDSPGSETEVSLTWTSTTLWYYPSGGGSVLSPSITYDEANDEITVNGYTVFTRQ